MSLASRFRDLYAEAAQRGEAFASLQKGATIKVRCAGRRRQVILGRAGVKVGDVELVTFREHGRIPPEADQSEYTSKGWFYTVLTWEEPPGLFDEEE